MATLLFITISILCSLFFLTSSQQYVFVDELVISTSANQRCQDLFGTHLASIHSAADNLEAQILCVTQAGDARPGCWIGLHDFDVEAYSNGNLFKWYDGSALDYTNWGTNEPNNYYSSNGGEDLVMILEADGLWNDGYTPWSLRLICWDSQSATDAPTKNPTKYPSKSSTKYPTKNPTLNPSQNPLLSPTKNPTLNPTQNPSSNPSQNPSSNPTKNPTLNPTSNPTVEPTINPSKPPTQNPIKTPTESPTLNADVSTTDEAREPAHPSKKGKDGMNDFLSGQAASIRNGVLMGSGIFVFGCILGVVLFWRYRTRKVKLYQPHSPDENDAVIMSVINSQNTVISTSDVGSSNIESPMISTGESDHSDSDAMYTKDPEQVTKGSDKGQCTDCGETKSGKIYDVDGLFYCFECWEKYED